MVGQKRKRPLPSRTGEGPLVRISVALLGAPPFSHAQKPPTNDVEGAAKEENVGAMHERETMSRVRGVKS